MIEETDASGNMTTDYIYFGGRQIAWRDSGGHVFYLFADALGSTRAVTTGSGTGQTPGQLCWDADYYPYGQENDYTSTLQTTACPPTYKFTGYEYDSETGNYYAYARYYDPRLGRFLSADPLGGSIANPQSLNRYSYVVNNPTSLIDPSGMGPSWPPPPPPGEDNGWPPWVSCTIDGTLTPCWIAEGMAGIPESVVVQCDGCGAPFPASDGMSAFWLEIVATDEGLQYENLSRGGDPFFDGSEFGLPDLANYSSGWSVGSVPSSGGGMPPGGGRGEQRCVLAAMRATLGGNWSLTPAGENGGHADFAFSGTLSGAGLAILQANQSAVYPTNSSRIDTAWGVLHVEPLQGMPAVPGAFSGTVHIDLVNPDDGLLPMLGHGVVDGLWGHVVQLFGGNIDKGC